MNFGILVFNQVEELDFVGPWEMLTMWQKVADGPENCLLISESQAPVTWQAFPVKRQRAKCNFMPSTIRLQLGTAASRIMRKHLPTLKPANKPLSSEHLKSAPG